jgi:hypothetical protein
MSHCQTPQKQEASILAIKQTADFLWRQQNEDGAWHSQTHGLLKGGQAYTPFLLHILLQVPDSIFKAPPGKISKSLQFIRQKMSAQIKGEYGLVLEYPVYSAAYSLQVLRKLNLSEDQKLIAELRQYLINQQFTEKRNISPTHPAYGGWGFGETRLAEGEVGHVDLSVTRRVLEALALDSIPLEVKQKARNFLLYVQKNPIDKRPQPLADTSLKKNQPLFYDGGFYYSPIILGANKAKFDEKNPAYQPFIRSYATATCDGLLAYLAMKESADSEPFTSAKAWLFKNESYDFPPGIPQNEPERWFEVMVLYHLAVRSEVYQKINSPNKWAKKMQKVLEKYRQNNASYSNPLGARNKENDPLLGSAFALQVLLNGLMER